MKPVLAAFALAQVATLAAAQAPAVPAAANASIAGVAWQCGGVGSGEQDRFLAQAARHDLLLTFATPSGAYLADVDVQVTHRGRTLLQVRCDGPLMLVDLPGGGDYQVTASFEGQSQRKPVNVDSRLKRLLFTWPRS